MLALAWNDELQSADLRVENGLVEDDTLATSIIISLFTDARARPSDILPNGDTDRRGWVGDALSETEGDRIGSRLWLLRRAKETEETRRRAEGYAREALTWIVETGMARGIDVLASWQTRGWLQLHIDVTRPSGDVENYLVKLQVGGV
tara:strand:- start:10104 stop:10547 length:444 start_codon:yes stop_codon:yes gene_type:complete